MKLPGLSDFYIRHRSQIAAVLDIREKARRELPDWVRNNLRDALQVEDRDLIVVDEPREGGFYWYDRERYDPGKNDGLWFAVYRLSKESLLDRGDPPYLCVGIDVPRTKSPGYGALEESVRQTISVNRRALRPSGVRLGPQDDDRRVIAYYLLDEIVNLELLASDPWRNDRTLARAAREFTESLMKILPPAGLKRDRGRSK